MIKLISYVVYHRLNVDARKIGMFKKIFILSLVSSFLWGSGRKHSIERDFCEGMHVCKKMKGEEGIVSCEEKWEKGFIDGILFGWRMLEHRPLPCGCVIPNAFVKRQFYDVLKLCAYSLSGRDTKKILLALLAHIEEHKFLIDATCEGKILPCVFSLFHHCVQEKLVDYNARIAALNYDHAHDYSRYEPSYYS
jgi:hypothetical protein